jgi:hypothetical protein
VLKVFCACRFIGEYPLKLGKRRRKTAWVHITNLASGHRFGNQPDRQAWNQCISRRDLASLPTPATQFQRACKFAKVCPRSKQPATTRVKGVCEGREGVGGGCCLRGRSVPQHIPDPHS